MSEGVKWAGHDAQSMARVSRAGMIFIPSVNGRSHSKDEYSRDEDLVKGLLVLLNVVLALDSSYSLRYYWSDLLECSWCC
jgi:acetylornithine deacetylase/succinyl-diaminopimelate desuccinylase-like protein